MSHNRTSSRLLPIVLVFFGGGLGTTARYLLDESVVRTPNAWPLSTFAINVAGAFLLGAVLGWQLPPEDVGVRQRRMALFLGTGFCGGFTTYSAFAFQTQSFVRDHQWILVSLYPAATVVFGLLLCVLGMLVSQRLWRTTS